MDARCAVCHGPFEISRRTCVACHAVLHVRCGARCPTPGCKGPLRSIPMPPEGRPGHRLVGWQLVAVTLILIVLGSSLAVNLVEARRNGNEAAAIGSLKAIAFTQAIFREGDRDGDGLKDYGFLSELGFSPSDPTLVDASLASGTKRGYVFQSAPSFTTSEFLWFAVANPERPGITGDRSFETNQAGVIFYTTAGPLALDTSSCDLPRPGWQPSK